MASPFFTGKSRSNLSGEDRFNPRDVLPTVAGVVSSLMKSRQIAIVDGQLRLTKIDINKSQRDKLLFPKGPNPDPKFRVHVGPIATGKTVRQDRRIFSRIAKFSRKVIGLEMEAAAIGYVAEAVNVPSIIVKSVMDYGDQEKDNSFRNFAALTSANFLIAFLTEHPPSVSERSTAYPTEIRWLLDRAAKKDAEDDKFRQEIKGKIDHILGVIEDKSISPQEVGIARNHAAGDEQTIVLDIPAEQKGSELERKLRAAVGEHVVIRYKENASTIHPSLDLPNVTNGVGASSVRPLHVGLGFQREDGLVGPLGPFIELSNGEPGFVTVAHLFGTSSKSRRWRFPGSPIMQGSPAAGNAPNIIGFLHDSDAIPGSDVAIVRLKYGTGFLGNIVPLGYNLPFEGEVMRRLTIGQMEQMWRVPVFKFGRTSGLSTGRISAFSMQNVKVDTGRHIKTFNDVIEVQPEASGHLFSAPGDSGALVYGRVDGHVVCIGMVFAGAMLADVRGGHDVSCRAPSWLAG
jgi:hypothetical protein